MTANIVQKVDAVVVGAGFSGLYLIKQLTDRNFTVRGFEAGDQVGGTWYWNRYPGARCDLESFDYSYTFSPELEKEWTWSERYPQQAEILRYINHVADRFNLRPHIQLSTTVTSAIFDETKNVWNVTTDKGEHIECRFCIMATGGLSVPKPPEYEGLETFKGQWYHTALWPHEGVDFTGKKVAVIGTGSTGVQVIATIADQVSEMTVFQRTPNFTVPRIDFDIDPEMMEDFRQHAAERHVKSRQSRYGLPIDFPTESALSVTSEERTHTYQNAWDKSHLLAYRLTYADILTDETANDTVAEFLRAKIRSVIKDPELAKKLIPTGFPFGTKRPCLGKNYYETFNRENVKLVDLRDTPILRVTPSGIQTTEVSLEFDSIIFATGFDALTGAVARIDVHGRDGLTLKEKWKEGPRAYLGLMTNKFPNIFFVTGPGSPGPLSNMIVSIEQHVEWIADCMDYMRAHKLIMIEPEDAADISWAGHVQEVVNGTLYLKADSWYLGANVPGKPRIFMPYLGGAGAYRKKCTDVAQAGYTGFVLEPEAA